jgi:poly [ADP-ribose] polymerase
MSNVKEKVRLVFSDLKKNSYKYWDGLLYEDGRVESVFGVVGAKKPQSRDFGNKGESFFRSKIREKERKGYTHAKVIMEGDNTSTQTVNKSSLADIALSQINLSDSNLKPLIKRLADSNVHKITSATSISFDDGIFQTPLGVVTRDGIEEARDLLNWFYKNVKKNGKDAFNEKVDEYLKIIPRPKGRGLQYEDIFPDLDTIKKESDVLDALDNSVEMVMKPKATKKGKTKTPIEKVFNLDMALVTDKKVIKKITDWYTKTNKAMHYYTNVTVKNVYAVDIVDYNANFLSDDPKIVDVWHGSGQANILSILKTGLFTAPPSTAAIAGKMFGNGVYGSETASKALGYSLGRWGQSSGDSGWLFVCDFAMGKPYYPKSSGNIPKGYDSCWALPKNTSLLNDELIVYNENRIKIKYLLEVK